MPENRPPGQRSEPAAPERPSHHPLFSHPDVVLTPHLKEINA